VTDYECDEAHGEIELADLAAIGADEFRRRFRRTPLWRTHPDGMRRNALVVAGNAGHAEVVEEARRRAAADPDPEVRAVAAWAVARLAGRSDDAEGEGNDEP
jgi:epoxyqueuosine reductase